MNRARNNMNANQGNANGGMNGTGRNGNPMNGMNGANGNGINRAPMNGMNGNGVNMRGRVGGATDNSGRPLTGTLAEQIRALTFVKAELELYLDTHPTCPTALDYYYQTIRELERLTEEYNNTVGALTAKEVITSDGWTWATTPWPWQQAGDFTRNGEGR